MRLTHSLISFSIFFVLIQTRLFSIAFGFPQLILHQVNETVSTFDEQIAITTQIIDPSLTPIPDSSSLIAQSLSPQLLLPQGVVDNNNSNVQLLQSLSRQNSSNQQLQPQPSAAPKIQDSGVVALSNPSDQSNSDATDTDDPTDSPEATIDAAIGVGGVSSNESTEVGGRVVASITLVLILLVAGGTAFFVRPIFTSGDTSHTTPAGTGGTTEATGIHPTETV